MRGVILAGGTGSRLDPLTRATNKHLLPLGGEPMISRAVRALSDAGLAEVMVTTDRGHIDAFRRVLGDGREYRLDRLEFACQERPGGIPEAIALAEEFAAGLDVVVLLADNLYERPLAPWIEGFTGGARALLSRTDDIDVLRQVAVPVMAGGRIRRVVEKPAAPASCYAVTGAYIFDSRVFELIPTLRPSTRQELEVADLLNWYAERGELGHDVIGGYWADAGGSIAGYYAACDRARGLESA
jgi:glucose-1-phosphate thymidylyltransferase